MKKTLGILVLILLIALGGYYFYQNQQKEVEKTEHKTEEGVIKVGAVLNLIGNNSEWGTMAKRSIDLIVNDYNIKHKTKIEMIYEDSKEKPTYAVSSIKKLIYIDNVYLILGDMLSSTTLAMAPIAEKNKKVLIGISCSSPSITNAGEYIYRVWPSDLYEGEQFAKWVLKNNINKISILSLNNDYGDGLKNAFKNTFKNNGKILSEDKFNESEKNFKNIIIKMLAKKPQAVYIVGYYQNTALLIKQIREYDKDIIILGTSSSINDKLIKISKEASEGFIAAVVNDFDVKKLDIRQKEFIKKFYKKYNINPDWAAIHAADATFILIELLEKKIKEKNIKQYIDNNPIFNGISKNLQFDRNGDVINKPIAIKIIKKGKFIDYE